MNSPEPVMPWEEDDAISQRAAEYFQRKRFWGWSEADQAGLDGWLAESTLHRAAYLRVEGIIAYTQRLAARRGPASVRGATGTGTLLQRRFVIPLLAAASVALLVAFENPLVNALSQSPDRTYSTDVGGRTLLNFADHTQIELNTDTLVHFRMTGEERTVWLEKGEAWFHVSHNAANPFTVVVGKHRVTDLGTEFLVRRGSGDMEVALLNGRATLSAEGSPTTVLKPGDDAVATQASVSVTRKTPQELADALAWRRGVLAFRNTKLADVVRQFNRYNTTKLVISDPAVAGEKISADLKTDDYEGFLQLAQAVLDVRAEREGGVILISRAAKNSGRRAP